MSLGSGFALIAVGAVVLFTFTGTVLGLDVDLVGFVLVLVGAVALGRGLLRRRRSR